jgi:hypothetical protein
MHSNTTPQNRGDEKQSSINNATQQKAGSLVRQLLVAKEGPEEELLRVEHHLCALLVKGNFSN